jgi:hypothetical protein
MKTEYLIGYVEPFKRKVTYKKAFSKEELEKSLENRKKFYDYVIIRKDVDNEGVESFTLEKSGYGIIYVVLNKLFIILTFMLLLLFSYLYFKFFNTKN